MKRCFHLYVCLYIPLASLIAMTTGTLSAEDGEPNALGCEFVSEDLQSRLGGLSKIHIVESRTADSSTAFERTLRSIMPSPHLQEGCAVTCEMDGGRLADNLLAYLHARWISYKYGIPLLYKRFDYADRLMLSTIDHPLSSEFHFQHHVWLKNGRISRDQDLDPDAFSTLYEVPWFPESLLELEMFPFYKPNYFAVDWDDPGFHAEVLQCLQPKSPLVLPYIPHDRIVVGVHVRTGVGWDSPFTYKVLPTKFPPFDYYIEQIKRIAEIFQDQPLYIYLFTDDPNPRHIANTFELAVNNPNLEFLYRENDNYHNKNVLEDLFALTECDCLIRGESYFSLLASKLTDYMVMITPAGYRFEGDKLFIDQVNIKYGNNSNINLK